MSSAVTARLKMHVHRATVALLCAIAVFAAGCHRSSNTSYYGIGWITLTDQPGDYTSYIVTIDSITLTRNDGLEFTVLGTPEIVDLVQLKNYAELWGSISVPDGTYTSATIALDYTSAAISVNVNGVPKLATVTDAVTGAAATTYSISVAFDPASQPTITPTFASTSAQLINIDVDLAASGLVAVPASGTPTVSVRPFLTVNSLPDDQKPIRIRGPLINSSTDVQSYTVYIRPFYDEANNIGTVSMFSQANTVYTINGNAYIGSAGLSYLSQLSAGTTVTAAYTTFQPDYDTAYDAYAGRFNLLYVVAGSTLEDVYTEGISGDVIARNGNTLHLRGATLFLNTADTFEYLDADSTVLLGPGTIVTADDEPDIKGLDSDSIAVGQHITVRGEYSTTSAGTVVIDATGTSSTNTGSVRLQPAELWGTLAATGTGSVTMDVATIDNWPASIFNFAGNGPVAPNAAAFSITTPSLTLPAGTSVGDLIYVDGYFNKFGSAPPDFTAVSLNNDLSVQYAGGPVGGAAATTPGGSPTTLATSACGIGSQLCEQASLQVTWSGTATAGTATPFSDASDASFRVDLSNAKLSSAVIRIGQENIPLKSLPESPLVVPTQKPISTLANSVATGAPLFAPRFAYGNPATASTTSSVTSTTSLITHSSFQSFVTGVNATMTTANPALQLEARGIFDRTNNIFYATTINLVL